jgi:hypothetical protein
MFVPQTTSNRWATNRGGDRTFAPTIYAAKDYSSAKLVHGNGHMPPNQHWIRITIPPGVSYEVCS